jgi:uncharacterized protein (DUF3084 family)
MAIPVRAPSIAGSEYSTDGFLIKLKTFQLNAEEKAEVLEDWQRTLEQRDNELCEKETSLDARESGLNQNHNDLRKRKTKLDERESGLNQREAALIRRETELQEREWKLSLDSRRSEHTDTSRQKNSTNELYDIETQKADIEKVYSDMRAMKRRDFELRKLLKDLDLEWVLGAERAR